MKLLAILAVGAGCAVCGIAQTPGTGEIMARVAANQAKSLDARRLYVYDQDLWLRMTRASGKLAREERRKYVVSPSENHADRQLRKLEGKYEARKGFVSYDKPGFAIRVSMWTAT